MENLDLLIEKFKEAKEALQAEDTKEVEGLDKAYVSSYSKYGASKKIKPEAAKPAAPAQGWHPVQKPTTVVAEDKARMKTGTPSVLKDEDKDEDEVVEKGLKAKVAASALGVLAGAYHGSVTNPHRNKPSSHLLTAGGGNPHAAYQKPFTAGSTTGEADPKATAPKPVKKADLEDVEKREEKGLDAVTAASKQPIKPTSVKSVRLAPKTPIKPAPKVGPESTGLDRIKRFATVPMVKAVTPEVTAEDLEKKIPSDARAHALHDASRAASATAPKIDSNPFGVKDRGPVQAKKDLDWLAPKPNSPAAVTGGVKPPGFVSGAARAATPDVPAGAGKDIPGFEKQEISFSKNGQWSLGKAVNTIGGIADDGI